MLCGKCAHKGQAVYVILCFIACSLHKVHKMNAFRDWHAYLYVLPLKQQRRYSGLLYIFLGEFNVVHISQCNFSLYEVQIEIYKITEEREKNVSSYKELYGCKKQTYLRSAAYI